MTRDLGEPETRPEIGLSTLDSCPQPRRAGRVIHASIPATASDGAICLALVARSGEELLRYQRALEAGALRPGRLACYDLRAWRRSARAEAPHVSAVANDAELALAARDLSARIVREIETDLDGFLWRREIGEKQAVYDSLCLSDEVSGRRLLLQIRAMTLSQREALGMARVEVEAVAAEEAARYPYRSPKGVEERAEALLMRNAPRVLPGDILSLPRASGEALSVIAFLTRAGWNVAALGALWTLDCPTDEIVDLWSGETFHSPTLTERRSA